MNLISAKTYEIVSNPPPAMPWDEYAKRVQEDWQALLNSPEASVEANLQRFLEAHPCMVPGAQSMSGTSGHSPFPSALIRQPKLPAFSHRIPDFMWLASDSMTNYAVLIEIETPNKAWFNRAGVQTAEFSQAQNQISEWKLWFDNPINQLSFFENYGPFDSYKKFLPEYVLIFGSRREFLGRPQLNAARHTLQRTNEHYMTFDRLHPIKDSDQYMTVERTVRGFEAVSVPPTLELGPLFARQRQHVLGKEEAVDRSSYMTDARKAFLKERFKYWDSWARDGSRGLQNSGDWE